MVKSGNKLWATSPLSLTSKTAVVMLALGAPLVLLHLCDYVAQNTAGDSPNGKRDVMLFDIFCGKQALSSAYREQGYKTLSFDVELHPRCHDITSMTGFIRGIQYTLRLAEDSLLHGGPPCGTYVWVNRATSKRSGECPDGDASVPSVANANLITSRFALLMLLALCRCCFVAAEQPRSSLMPLSTPMDHLRLVLEGILPWNVQHFWMATWGSLTAKPSMSFGIAPFAAGLYRKFTKGKRLAVQKKLKKKNLQIVKQHVDAQGRKRVTGLKDLKKTQEYPKGYGKQVLKLHRDFVAQKPGFLREHLYGDDPAPTAAHFNARQIIQNALSNDQNWLMADLGDARAFLRAERARGKFTPVFDAGLDD